MKSDKDEVYLYQPPHPFLLKNNPARNRIKNSLFPYAEDKTSEAECCSCHCLPVPLLEGPIKIEKGWSLCFSVTNSYILFTLISLGIKTVGLVGGKKQRPVTAICSDHKGCLSTECLIKPFLSRILINYRGCRPLNPVQSWRWSSLTPLPLHTYQCHRFQCYPENTKHPLLKANNSTK